jgi:hypothetical protein
MARDSTELNPVRTLSGVPLVAAIIALVLWAAFIVVMIYGSGSYAEIQWTRLAFLFASVEAVAFAAGGALWGASIQRERAEKAEAAAEANRQDAANGRALAAAVAADESAAADGAAGLDQPFGGQSPAASAVAERHARLARSLFPDL